LIALKALLDLAELIELQRLPCSVTNSESGPSRRRGGIDALRMLKLSEYVTLSAKRKCHPRPTDPIGTP
jgi:hypothetical protein